ncbi:MAG: hypothetical protein H6625_00240 [Bdellovibrionaceae bacterium]|nr:hypothetical protein [Pseudobdellovibrionaceae bacterium]
MTKSMITLLSLFLALALTACSSNWKEGSSGISEEELFEELNSMSTFSAAGNGSGSGLFNTLKEDPNTKIYFARSGNSDSGGLGPAYSVVSFGDFSVFASGQEDLSAFDLETAKVALLDGFDTQGKRIFVLAVSYQIRNGQAVSFFAEDEGYEFGKQKLQIQFSSNGQTYILETFDIREGQKDLMGSIHLKMIHVTEGHENEIGQFSFLEGFGQ